MKSESVISDELHESVSTYYEPSKKFWTKFRPNKQARSGPARVERMNLDTKIIWRQVKNGPNLH